MKAHCKISIRGAVQGVGFRPFIFRLATELGLTGWVLNSPQGVFIEAEGEKHTLDSFLLRIEKEKPPLSFIQSFEFSFLDPVGFEAFEIRHSESNGETSAFVLPDIATCSDCLNDIFEPGNRRYLYPFTNCTNCGPRFSIIEALPYDRQNTTMKKFELCDDCLFEYNNPLDRRFHAQPNACPRCGPHLELWDINGNILSTYHQAILQTAEGIRAGKIIALKGLGGFHLIVDARNDDAVVRLRQRKHREEKPFALMFPSDESIKEVCEVSEIEERLLRSPESPIVLLAKIHLGLNELLESEFQSEIHNLGTKWRSRLGGTKSEIRNPYIGAMLPYTPLHHLLMKELGFPIVATSGNLSDEPICIDEHEALKRLHGIADAFLVHNRPIKRHVDDSVVRIVAGREMVVRRARGYAPLPIECRSKFISTPLDEGRNEFRPTILAVGAHLKNTVAITTGNNIFISQHIGDLETKESFEAFQNVIQDFKKLYNIEPKTIVCDLHPEYLSTKFAKQITTHQSPLTNYKSSIVHRQSDIYLMEVQHHYAHVASCMAENQLDGQALGVSWDGTGFGTDGTIWGGEFLLTNDASFERVATFRTFPLPGGEKAIKEPRRTALGLLYEMYDEKLFSQQDTPLLHYSTTPLFRFFKSDELVLMRTMLAKNINCPTTTSVGRLFDAVASLLDVRQRVSFEGQAAMELEFLTNGVQTDEHFPFEVTDFGLQFTDTLKVKSEKLKITHTPITTHQSHLTVNWLPIIEGILIDQANNVSPSLISARFHNTLTEIIIEVAKRIGEERIVLSGGCFQNKYLTERTVTRLQQEGFRPYWHQRVPTNDGGIALGQMYAAMRLQRKQDLPDLQQLEETIL
ncbi:MAG: carbamoyltransferase HypF [Ignavibacteriae bacterium]|nr:carbamoyltransferase HypF [Ignavibacteriota bacterium]